VPEPEEEADLFVSDTDVRQSQTDPEDSGEREQQGREQQEREQQEREQQEREQEEERERQEREQREEREQQEREQRVREDRQTEIYFARWEDDTWKHMPALSVDTENPAIVKRTIEDYMTQGIRAFNTKLTIMAPDAYYQAVMNDRTHTILLVPQDKISIDNKMIDSAAKLREDAIRKVIGLKRTAPDDSPESPRPRKMH
jgi:signal recognition particle GTPase